MEFCLDHFEPSIENLFFFVKKRQIKVGEEPLPKDDFENID